MTLEDVEDADWENNWKQYYKPMEIGERLMVIPDWEEADPKGRAALRLNPGLAFGTGGHATTRLCLTSWSGPAPRPHSPSIVCSAPETGGNRSRPR